MTSAIPVQCSQRSWVRNPFRPEFFFQALISQLVCVTAMINHKILSFSAVQIYDLSYIHLHCAVFLNRTICSHSASLHPNAKKDMGKVILWGKPYNGLASSPRWSKNIPSRFKQWKQDIGACLTGH